MKRKEDILLTACIVTLMIMNIIALALMQEMMDSVKKIMTVTCGSCSNIER